MKVAVFGSDGMLGTYVQYCLKNKNFNYVAINKHLFDVKQEKHILFDFLKKLKITHIINCTCVTNNNSYDNILINSIFPKNLEIFAKNKNIKLIHISTNAVFDGKQGNYIESSVTNPNTLYGITKLNGELKYGLTIRTSIIGENNKGNFIIENIKKNDTIKAFVNHYWNGITAYELAKEIIKFLDYKSSGTIHLKSDKIYNKYELYSLINDSYNLNKNIIDIYDNSVLSNNLTLDTIYSHKNKNLYDMLNELKEVGYEIFGNRT